MIEPQELPDRRSASTIARARVLVVDNESPVCADLDRELRLLGYEVMTVCGQEVDLAGQAVEAAWCFRPHVAIIDLRLRDEHMDELSGLELGDEIGSAHCIIYSAYMTTSVARRITQWGDRATWINKQDDPQDLLDAVAAGVSRRCASDQRGLAFVWPDGFDGEQVSRSLLDENGASVSRLVEDVLAQLFPTRSEFVLTAVTGAAAKAPASRGHSVVLRLEGDHRQPTIVKLMRAAQFRTEERNYREHVEDKLGGPFNTVRRKGVEFWDVGAVEYTFMGAVHGAFPTYSSMYADEVNSDVLLRPLRHFFATVWRPHYSQSVALGSSLFADYDRSLGLCRKLVAFRRGPAPCTLPEHLTDPVAWVLAHADDSRIPGARAAVTHGDLHADNLFALRGLSWIIDYERTGLAHCLRDFAELEVDILTRLVDASLVRDGEFLRMAVALAAPTTAGAAPSPLDLAAPHTEVYKALAVLQGLRQIAREVTRYSDAREYLWALLLDSLFVASLPATTAYQRRRAYLLAAVLCDRLQRWEQTWPPADWPSDPTAWTLP